MGQCVSVETGPQNDVIASRNDYEVRGVYDTLREAQIRRGAS
jgi:hypothetical protein